MGIGPKVVLASLPSLSAGPARELLAQWAGDPHSAVVMPGTPQVGRVGGGVGGGVGGSAAHCSQQHAASLLMNPLLC